MATNTILYSHEGETNVALNPQTVATQVQINSEGGEASNVEAEIIALRQKLTDLTNAGIHFRGSLTADSGLPTVGYKAGWQYVVQTAGTYAGKACEVGDFVVCIKDYASGSASDKDWTVLQVNIVGAVTGPASSVAAHVATFDGTSGKIIKDSGFTIQKSVPADAQFTDTTYGQASASTDGLMSVASFTKLSGIEAGADKTDADNVKAAGAVMKTGSADDLPQGKTNLYMTPAERTKLSGITNGAEANQNAFSNLKVGNVTVSADSKTDTLEIAAGSGITITADAMADKVTVAETYIDSCVVSSLDNVPKNLRNGGLVILKG